ncbi:hypothetical protein HC762_01825 [bacterium]|nr:hypothetical protein [bacterium]
MWPNRFYWQLDFEPEVIQQFLGLALRASQCWRKLASPASLAVAIFDLNRWMKGEPGKLLVETSLAWGTESGVVGA